MRSILISVLCVTTACGDDGGGTADAVNVPAMVNVMGTATGRMDLNSMPLPGVTVTAYRVGNDTTVMAMATTDASGNYTLTIPTNGMPLDGYIKGTIAGYVDVYLYPPRPVTKDYTGASLNLLTQGTIDLLSGTLCGSLQMSAMGAIGVIVRDAAEVAVGGAAVSSSPTAAKYCYNGSSGLPDRQATMTAMDGTAYMLNVAAGNVTVSATKSGSTFMSHPVNARAGVLTTTTIEP
jgi:hypothetical protein